MNWLIIEGYQDVATQFQQETGVLCKITLHHSHHRHHHHSTFTLYSLFVYSYHIIIYTATIPLHTITSRNLIRECICRGEIEQAIQHINDVNPEVRENILTLHLD